jgi:hypothetical protein
MDGAGVAARSGGTWTIAPTLDTWACPAESNDEVVILRRPGRETNMKDDDIVKAAEDDDLKLAE